MGCDNRMDEEAKLKVTFREPVEIWVTRFHEDKIKALLDHIAGFDSGNPWSFTKPKNPKEKIDAAALVAGNPDESTLKKLSAVLELSENVDIEFIEYIQR